MIRREGDAGAHLLAVHYIGWHAKRAAAQLLDACHRLFAALGDDIGDHHIRSDRSERKRDRAADAAASAGDHRHLISEKDFALVHGSTRSVPEQGNGFVEQGL